MTEDDMIARHRAGRAAAAPLHREVLDMLKDQLLIVLVNRLGGDLRIPAVEIDGTGGFTLAMSVDPDAGTFTFSTERKQ